MMTRREGLGMMFGGLTATMLGGCSALFRPSYRVRMTVVVDTPAGQRSGSSVLEISASRLVQGFRWLGAESAGASFRGEAAVVELADGPIFMLISGSLKTPITAAFEKFSDPDGFIEAVAKLGRRDQVGRRAILPPKDYTKFVRFRNIADPSSVEELNLENLHQNLGNNASLKEVTLQITNERVQEKIIKILPWLPLFYDKQLDGQNTNKSGAANQLANNLSSGVFSSESAR